MDWMPSMKVCTWQLVMKFWGDVRFGLKTNKESMDWRNCWEKSQQENRERQFCSLSHNSGAAETSWKGWWASTAYLASMSQNFWKMWPKSHPRFMRKFWMSCGCPGNKRLRKTELIGVSCRICLDVLGNFLQLLPDYLYSLWKLQWFTSKTGNLP